MLGQFELVLIRLDVQYYIVGNATKPAIQIR